MAQSTWNPSLDQIAKLEVDLAKFLAKIDPRSSRNLSTTYLQYAGLVVNGKKVIYVNAIPDFILRDHDAPMETIRQYWKTEAVVIFDGGAKIWGVEYDIESGCFNHISHNGTA